MKVVSASSAIFLCSAAADSFLVNVISPLEFEIEHEEAGMDVPSTGFDFCFEKYLFAVLCPFSHTTMSDPFPPEFMEPSLETPMANQPGPSFVTVKVISSSETTHVAFHFLFGAIISLFPEGEGNGVGAGAGTGAGAGPEDDDGAGASFEQIVAHELGMVLLVVESSRPG